MKENVCEYLLNRFTHIFYLPTGAEGLEPSTLGFGDLRSTN